MAAYILFVPNPFRRDSPTGEHSIRNLNPGQHCNKSSDPATLKLNQSMMQFFRQLGDWFDAHPSLLWLLTGFSVFAFFATLIAVPILVAWIPADYFAHPARQRILFAGRSPLVRSGLLMGKNLLGVILLIMGIAMLVLPGQGLLTILVGLLLIDFPGKYHWQKWLASRPPVLRAINWLRKRRGAPPIKL